MRIVQATASALLSQCVYNEDEKIVVHITDVPDSLMLHIKYFIFNCRRR